jgi:hypothetical protein
VLVILHETDQALMHARTLCDHLMGELWAEVDLDLHQWPFDRLWEQATSEEAASKAAVADLVVVAAAPEGEFAPEFVEWTERLVGLRQHHEGALVGLFAPVDEAAPGVSSSRDVHLHRVALRAGMDYLKHLPDHPSHGIPDLNEWCSSRATKFTGTLDQIIRTEPLA